MLIENAQNEEEKDPTKAKIEVVTGDEVSYLMMKRILVAALTGLLIHIANPFFHDAAELFIYFAPPILIMGVIVGYIGYRKRWTGLRTATTSGILSVLLFFGLFCGFFYYVFYPR